MAFNWGQILGGKTAAELLDEMLAKLKPTFPVDDWGVGAVVRVILEKAFAPVLESVWSGLGSVAAGGFLRLAQALAEADLDSWKATPEDHWLYTLATELYAVAPKPAEFLVGTLRLVNSGAAPQTVTSSHVAATSSGLLYQVQPDPTTGATSYVIPAGGTIYVPIKSEKTGTGYNVAQGAITLLTVTIPNVTVSNVPDPATGAASWISTFGADTETPKQLADRCAARWGRLTKLQALPADGYISLALDSSSVVKKVAVWSSYSHALPGFKANTVTLYLGSESGPVDAAVAAAVRAAMLPYIGLHDALEVQPCGTQTLTLTGTVYVETAAKIPSVKAAIEAAIIAYEASLNIGQKVYGWKIKDLVGVAGVVNYTSTFDGAFVPNKNALVDIDYTQLVYQVEP